MVQSVEAARRQGAPGSRVPPQNLDAEQSLLGAMLLSRDAIAAAMEICSSEDFYKPAHSHIFDAINNLYNIGEPADPVTVADELARAGLLDAVGGLSALVSLQADTPATTNAARYARIIEEHALLRRLISVAGEIAEMGYSLPEDVESAIDRAEAMVFDVAERRVTDSLKPLTELLFASMDRLAALFDRGDSVTGVPTGYVDLDEKLYGLQPSTLVIVGARPAMGKCVAWDTRVMDPATGALCTVEELYWRMEDGRRPFRVLSLGEDRKLAPAPVGGWVYDGYKPVFRVRTRSGRQVRTTAPHPFLTPDGWRPLADLAVGARIAVPRRYPAAGTQRMGYAELLLLAHVLGDDRCTGSRPRVRSTAGEVADELEYLSSRLGMPASARSHPTGATVTSFRFSGGGGQPNPLLALLRDHDLLGVRADQKRIPQAVFRLIPSQVSLFLNRLLAGTGTVSEGRVYYYSVSRGLVRDVQHLLLRSGIDSQIRFRAVDCEGDPWPAWELRITDPTDIARFCDHIGICGKETECGALVDDLRTRRAVESAAAAGGASGGGGYALATLPASRVEAVETDVDIVWDEIEAIVPDGEERVYDLTVPGNHNFVADDVVVHNTAFALGMAAHAAMEAQVPTLVFSLEMAADEITQRLLVSEARVDAGRMRNGRLLDSDWPKISQAVARLGEAPLFIDDNPSTTIMEIRAKARRLKARHGNLGLIIVDYLQLMSGGHGNSENRQLEVSAISRGLKILARELEVPVVALSQLSRNLEQRSDKRPVLADLRESGSLEQDADVVLFLYRDEMYNAESTDRGTAEVIVAKHRNGPTGKLQLAFLDHYTRFANMARV